jgi:hypothetical protein
MFSISFPRLARSALSLALFVSVSLRVSAEEAAANKHAHHGGMMHGKKGPDLGSNAEFDAQGHLWAVHKLEEKIVLRRSDDLGKTWAAPVVVSAEPTDPGADARPKLALGKNQEIYLTWTHPMTKPFSGEIRFARSLDFCRMGGQAGRRRGSGRRCGVSGSSHLFRGFVGPGENVPWRFQGGRAQL